MKTSHIILPIALAVLLSMILSLWELYNIEGRKPMQAQIKMLQEELEKCLNRK